METKQWVDRERRVRHREMHDDEATRLEERRRREENETQCSLILLRQESRYFHIDMSIEVSHSLLSQTHSLLRDIDTHNTHTQIEQQDCLLAPVIKQFVFVSSSSIQ